MARPHRTPHDEWVRTAEAALAALSDMGVRGAYLKALVSAQRVAHDFDRTYYVLWSHSRCRFDITSTMPTGNFDIVQPDGTIVH